MARNVQTLLQAPVGESFTGPALFEPAAAAQLLAQLLGDNLRVTRKPVTDPNRPVNVYASEFEGRTGSRVLPEWIDVVDDPTQTSYQGKPLAGYYPFDFEGVKAASCACDSKRRAQNFLDDAPAGEESGRVEWARAFPGWFRNARRRHWQSIREAGGEHAAGGSQDAAHPDVQGARQALRPADSQTRFSVPGKRRRDPDAANRFGEFRRIGTAGESSHSDVSRLSRRARRTGPRHALPRALHAFSARHSRRFHGNCRVRLHQ